jgi:HK97 family phage major capsid protein
MTSYTKSLRDKRAALLIRQGALCDPNKSMTNADKIEYREIQGKLQDTDSELAKALNSKLDTRGDTGGSKAAKRERSYTHDSRVTGRTAEVLDSKQSVRTWVDRAAERGMTVESRDGRPQKIIGSSFDENAYWGARLGLTGPGGNAEIRALNEDTSGSGLAITPQSWTARFIDYMYPNTLLGQLGASIVPMTTELVNVPQFTAPVQPQWVAEGSATSLDGNPAFSTLQLMAHGMFYDITLYSMELAQDAYIQGDLPGVLAASAARNYSILIDQAGFYGISGNAGCPGFSNETGMQLRKWGQGGAASNTAHTGTAGQAIADTQEPSTMVELVRAKNIEPTGFATSPQLVGTMARLNVPAYAAYWKMPVDVQDLWNNHTAYSTTIPTTETDPAAASIPAQTGGTMTSLYAADWSRVLIGVHLGMQTAILRERYADQLQVGLLTYMRFSVRLSHPEGFVRSTGALTT